MKLRNSVIGWLGRAVLALLAAGCQTRTPSAPAVSPVPTLEASSRLAIAAPVAWGGQVRCPDGDCLMAVVEHENNQVAVHRLQGRASDLLDRHSVAYHPDSAVWLTDHLLAVAVEGSSGVDIFRLQGQRLVRLQQVSVNFAARDVIVAEASAGHYRLLVTPYSGKDVAWVDWWEDGRVPAKVQKVRWCEAPWHPVHVKRLPGATGGGFVAACLDDYKVIAVSDADLLAQPRVLATFHAVTRTARPSPSGKWLYVALETGERNARINLENGELQPLPAPPTGAVSIAPLSDDLVVWGDDRQLYIQRLGSKGQLLETRWLAASGFATGLQLLDIDGDGERDLVVFNSSPNVVDVIYGPLWEQAAKTPVVQPKK